MANHLNIQHLNPQQQAAVKHIDGPLLVIAGAGSGKTGVITHKIAYLIEVCQIQPKNIYAVTFTNKAAKEMVDRVAKLIKKSPGNPVNVSTFHSLGLNILKKEAAALDLHSNFTLFDAIDGMHLLKELSGNIAAVSDDNIKNTQRIISAWKNDLISPVTANAQACKPDEQLAARFFLAYQNALHAYNAVDFDDLITLPVKLFLENPAILEKWQNNVRYLLIDEYQDTNTAQYTLIKYLCGVRAAITVVGDDDQSIYAWRGAKPENIGLLQQDFPNLKVIKLEQNYRSTNTILTAANHLISHNPHVFEKKLWSTTHGGDPIRIICTNNSDNEIECVVHEILAHKFRYRHHYDHYAVLYRSNHQARLMEQALRLQGIPYQISGGQSFFDRTEIKDLFAYFRLMINEKDDAAFLRCVNTPRREIGPATLEKLGYYAKERRCSLLQACGEMGISIHLPSDACQRLERFAQLIQQTYDNAQQADPIGIIQDFIKDIHYENYLIDTSPTPENAKKRVNHIKELISWLTRLTSDEGKGLTFQDAIQKMMLIDLLDKGNEQNSNMVQLMTLHAAKGLEFPYVFILGWEEECLPHKNSIESDTIHEERRLAYVGMTRAQKTLVLTYAKQRKRYGEAQVITPSRFLDELPPELVQREGGIENASSPEEQRAKGQSHLDAMKAMLLQGD